MNAAVNGENDAVVDVGAAACWTYRADEEAEGRVARWGRGC